MNPANRLALIKRLAAARGLVSSVAGLMVASHVEVREEVSHATAHTRTVDTITDEEIDGWESGLDFDKAKTAQESETSILLSRDDRKKLAQDVAAAQLAKRLPFALVVYSPTVRVNRPACEADLNTYSQLSNFAHS